MAKESLNEKRWENCGSAVQNGGNGITASFGSVVVASSASDNFGWGIHLTPGSNCNAVNNTGYDNGSGNVTGCNDGNGCHQNYLP